jgi:hypothetical protein
LVRFLGNGVFVAGHLCVLVGHDRQSTTPEWLTEVSIPTNGLTQVAGTVLGL